MEANRTPQISIIIPVYNAAPYLRKCFDSILGQTFTDYEVLIINDGSKDNSQAICEEYCERHPSFKLTNQPNAGVDKARNAGLLQMQGEYVTFVDSDDWVEEQWLEAYIRQLEKAPSDWLVQGVIVDDNHTARKEVLPGAEYTADKVLDGFIALEKHSVSGFIHNKMYKASLIKQENLKFEYTFKEDLLFNLKYAGYIRSLAMIGEAYYHYMQWSGESLIKRKYPFDYMLPLCNDLKEAGLKLSDKYHSSEYETLIRERYFSDYVVQITKIYSRQFKIGSARERRKIIRDYQLERSKYKEVKLSFPGRGKALFAQVCTYPPVLYDWAFALLFK